MIDNGKKDFSGNILIDDKFHVAEGEQASIENFHLCHYRAHGLFWTYPLFDVLADQVDHFPDDLFPEAEFDRKDLAQPLLFSVNVLVDRHHMNEVVHLVELFTIAAGNLKPDTRQVALHLL